jgi:hypothetical protein
MTQFLSVDDQQMESPLYGGHFSAVRVLSSRTRRIVRLWLGYCIAMLNRRHSQAAPFAWRTRIDPAIRTKCSFSPFLRKQIAMSQFNPYEPTQSRIGADPNSPRQVSINPIDLYKRSLALMGDQYWLFVGMTFLAILIGSVVPFGILMGPMFVGLYLCFKEREEGRRVEFGKLFQGFDEFVNSLIVTLILIVVSLVVIIPVYIIAGAGMFAILGAGQGNGPPQVNPIAIFGFIFVMFIVVSIASMAIYVPFMFAYQLVADQKVGGGQAFSMSLKASLKNLIGVLIFILFTTIVSMVAAMLCYLPAFLVMPISFGALWILYRDVFGHPTQG